ncbi:MAG: right-handed parallel beta-helix repeat-containing protein [Planctomycetes bacterium]|nr:right-handed parallel beta-helix repeat-containing protein [Planctomycetota bacterium]MBL7042926.1 right-handed parallel beta-helix repeat-containing protein [Pirellulaceae bacterium]
MRAIVLRTTHLVIPVVWLALHHPVSFAQAEAVLFVSPRGNDSWSGRVAVPAEDGSVGPLASLIKAVELSRQQAAGQTRRIELQEGEYYVNQPVDLGPKDAGLTIEASEGAEVVLYGGRRIIGWRRDGEKLWAADLPDVKEGKWDFRMLAIADRLCPRARLPKEGTFTHLSEFKVPWMSTTGGGWKRKPTTEELTTMKYRPEDLGPWLEVNNAEVTVYHMWDESVVGISRNDTENHVLTFSNPGGHPPGAFGVKKYVVWNTREGLTQPGQWYLDRTAGKIVYWPLPDEDVTAVMSIAPTVESILRIRGQEGTAVRDVTIRGLTLAVANTPLVAGGFGAGKFPGAVDLTHAENCRLVDLEIKNVGGQGIRAWKLKSCVIDGCHVHDTGACGLKFSGECTVRNNHVHHVGRIYPSGIAVWGGGRDGQTCHIEHNTIHDTPYTAIACGGDDHRIEHNRIFRAMQVLHDGGGIYITFCKRVVLRGNYIHDIVDTGGYGASAYYLDEQAEDCLVEDNLSVRVARPSHNHMARKNTLRNNVFVCDGDATMTFPRSSDYRLEKNVIVAGGRIRITRPEAISEAVGNIALSKSGKIEGVKLEAYRQAGTQPIESGGGWLLADPKLVEYESGKVRFAADSPAGELGIKSIDVSGAGCVKE